MSLSESFITLVKLLVAIAVAVTLASFAGKLHFVFDNFSNFRVQLAIAFALATVMIWLSGDRTWLAASAIGLAVNLAPVLPWYLSGPAGTANAANGSARILVSNVFLRNSSYEKLSELVSTEQPDIVGLAEVNARFLQNVPILQQLYPYRFEAPHDHYVGLALYSKLPMSDARIVHFGESATPAIVATISNGRSEVEFILAHPAPPMDAVRAAQRNEQLRRMAEHIRQSEVPVVLAGDLNATMWSPYYRDFASASGLKNARDGYGIGTTWPPIPGLGVPIDHIMATEESSLGNFRVLPGVGSDHLPISATLVFPGEHAYSATTDPLDQ